MPRVHKYRARNACYVLTAIRGAVVTFQLTADGEKKLAAARIGPGEQFPRALLDSLYRGYPSAAFLLWEADVGEAKVLPADGAGRPGRREGVVSLVENLSK
jgi:hypothetical protein